MRKLLALAAAGIAVLTLCRVPAWWAIAGYWVLVSIYWNRRT